MIFDRASKMQTFQHVKVCINIRELKTYINIVVNSDLTVDNPEAKVFVR